MNQLSSKEGISTFIQKLWTILEDHGVEEKTLRWTQNGLAFSIINKKQFSDILLPAYFKHSNFNSFVRQLNMYNFHKVKGDYDYQFKHDLFRKGRKMLLLGIKRNPTNSDLNFGRDLLEKLDLKTSSQLNSQSLPSSLKNITTDYNASISLLEPTSIKSLILENLKLKKEGQELRKSLDNLKQKSFNENKKFNLLLDYISIFNRNNSQNSLNINQFMQHLKSQQEPLSSSTQYGSFFSKPVSSVVPNYYMSYPLIMQPQTYQLPNIYYQ